MDIIHDRTDLDTIESHFTLTKWKCVYDCHGLSVTKEECPNLIADLDKLGFEVAQDDDRKYILLPQKT